MDGNPRWGALDGTIRAAAAGLAVGLPIAVALGVRGAIAHGHLAHGLGRLARLAVVDGLPSAAVLAACTGVGIAACWRGLSRVEEPGSPLVRLFVGVVLLLPALTVAAGALRGWVLQILTQSSTALGWVWLSAILEEPGAVALGLALVLLVARVAGLRVGAVPTGRIGDRAVFVVSAATALALGVWGAVQLEARRAGQGRPPVIFIAIDTLRADHLAHYGYGRPTDPSLAAFARDAITFRRAQAPAPWTTPSMAAALTGMLPARFGITDMPVRVPDRTVLLPEVLRDAGYRTSAVVSNLNAGSPVGFAQGFDVFDETESRGHNHISSPGVTKRAIDALSGRGPLFLYVHYFDPHYGYAQHEPYVWEAGYTGPIRPLDDIEVLVAGASGYAPEDFAYLKGLYDSEIRYTDDHLGALFAALRERGLYDDALIVLFADHGEAFGERDDRWIGHTKTVWQEQLHVPLIVKLPGNQHGGTEVSTPVGVVDIAPTVTALLGLSWPGATDGVALDVTAPVARPLFSETKRYARARALLDGDWKLVEDVDAGTTRLFDLRTDPGETEDRSADHPDVRARLASVLAAEVARTAGGTAEQASFSAEEQEMLRSLGYTGP